jgi:xanthine dehydrogenase accessory factor
MSPPTDDILDQAHHLRHSGEPFALASVVRVVRPASARPGSKALVRADGSIEGWVGGGCAQPSVAREALRALADGQPRLLCLVGEGGRAPEAAEGLVVQPMTCHSGGTIEVYIEPFVAAPRLLIVGQSAVSDALAQLGAALRYEVVVVGAGASAEHFPTASRLLPGLAEAAPLLTPRTYVVVATHGEYDEDALALALASEAAYVALIASRRRAATLADYLRGAGIPAERLARLRAPAGLNIGAAEPGEIALSILAEIVQMRRREASPPAHQSEVEIASAAPETAIDPVCGMTVEIATVRHMAEHAGQRYYFCCAGCKRSFEQAPEQYLAQAVEG